MGYVAAFILGSWFGVSIASLMRVAKLADEETGISNSPTGDAHKTKG